MISRFLSLFCITCSEFASAYAEDYQVKAVKSGLVQLALPNGYVWKVDAAFPTYVEAMWTDEHAELRWAGYKDMEVYVGRVSNAVIKHAASISPLVSLPFQCSLIIVEGEHTDFIMIYCEHIHA